MSAEKDLIIPTRTERSYRPPAVAGTDAATLMQIVERAMREPTFDIDKIQQMLTLKERWEANEARKAFTVAMAEFKANPPKIYKNKHVKFQTQKGVTEYDHATHSEVVEKIAAGLGQHGMSHRWNVEQSGGSIRVTCIITHALGHFDSVSMVAAPDTSGSKSEIQAIASTCTLLQRYTLIAATGLTSADLPDADDRTDEKTSATITDEQIGALEALITEVGADKAKFLAYIKASDLASIRAASYQTCVAALESKRKQS